MGGVSAILPEPKIVVIEVESPSEHGQLIEVRPTLSQSSYQEIGIMVQYCYFLPCAKVGNNFQALRYVLNVQIGIDTSAVISISEFITTCRRHSQVTTFGIEWIQAKPL